MKRRLLAAITIASFMLAPMYQNEATSSGINYGAPSQPYSVNGVFHLIVINGSDLFKQIAFETIFTVESKTLFFGTLNGTAISGEIIGPKS